MNDTDEQFATKRMYDGMTLADLTAMSHRTADAAYPLDLAVTRDRARHYSRRYCTSYTRLPAILRLKRQMFFADWWALLGEEWSICDNIASSEPRLRRLLQRARPDQLAWMMNREERDALTKLPRTLIVYRGCYGVNKRGLSWSLSKAIAMRFPTLNRYIRRGDVPLLLTGRVDRTRCVLKLDRNEDEIISGVVRRVGEEEMMTAA